MRSVSVKPDSLAVPLRRFMWDEPPEPQAMVLEKNFHDHQPGSSQVIQGFPGWRLMRHLPLRQKDQYVCGLTVYCNGSGICGMESHFSFNIRNKSKGKMLGYRLGCAITMCLGAGEAFTEIWLLHHGVGLLTTSPMVSCARKPYHGHY